MEYLGKGFAFIVETSEYAGSFQREMCAYLTGRVGECEVGNEFIKEGDLVIESVLELPDDNGCRRPVTLYAENGANNSVCIFFYEKPTKEEIDHMKERAYQFNEVRKTIGRMAKWNKDSSIKILGFKLLQKEGSVKELAI